MATRVADRVLTDTNILLSATDHTRADHKAALAVLTDWAAAGVALYASGQIFREYLAVAGRPVAANGLGLTRHDAVTNVRRLRARVKSLEENGKVADRLLDLLELVDCAGKQVHDANLVATMLVHGIDVVVTRNVEDFARFSSFVRAVDPLTS